MSAVSRNTPGLPTRGGVSVAAVVRRDVAWAIVGVSTVSLVVVAAVGLPRYPLYLLPWMLVYGASIAITSVVLIRMPRHPLALWLAIGSVIAAQDVVLWLLELQLASGATAGSIALWNLALQWVSLLPAIGVAHVLGLFPDGLVHRRYERVTLRLTWLAFAIPVVLLACSPTVVNPLRLEDDPPMVNPFKIPVVSLDAQVVSGLVDVSALAVILVGAVLLVLRYRSADAPARRPMRWLLAPVALLPIPVVAQLLLTGDADVIVSLCGAAVVVCFMVAPAVGILQPAGLSVDRVVRRSIVYGLLWTSIALVYLIVAATAGAAAGTLLPVGWAVAIALIAAIAFQPVRTRLERLADRWVFGAKTDPTQLVVGLGDSLADTLDLDTLLPRMRATLEDGMGLRWARVRLLSSGGDAEPSNPDRQPALTVPIEVDGERIGLIECGPKRSGHLTPADTGILETFARQAGMAVRNVRLKEELEDQAALLRTSRARIVHAQEQERRRIERNIHDGVQQDLTSLIGLAGHARQEFEHHPEAVGDDIEAMQEGLRRVLADLRDFAQGIHPSVLSDRGLLVAIETLAGRHPLPVSIRADASLRALRLPDALEGAAYFTIAEGLANALKHGRASRLDVELRENGDRLIVRVRDDGTGFDTAAARGTGLANLRDRVAAVGGALRVDSALGAGTTVVAELPLPREGRRR
ncbi:MAG: signal transduction histidine kinaselike protein [Microbacteriaceae bacterium]|nr:signal transduction histidine kinaselike protein [Microbacteriaceae bacterium]